MLNTLKNKKNLIKNFKENVYKVYLEDDKSPSYVKFLSDELDMDLLIKPNSDSDKVDIYSVEKNDSINKLRHFVTLSDKIGIEEKPILTSSDD